MKKVLLIMILVFSFSVIAEPVEFDKLSKVGSLINENLKDEDIQVGKGSIDVKDGVTTITLDDGGSLNLKGKLYMNLEEGAVFKVDGDGRLIKANFKSKGGEYYFIGKKIKVPAGAVVDYESGYLTVSDVDEFRLSVLTKGVYGDYNNVKVMEGSSVDIVSNSVLGNNFKIGDVQVNEGSIRLYEDRYVIEKGTEVNVNNLIFKTIAFDTALYVNNKPSEFEDTFLYIDEDNKYLDFKTTHSYINGFDIKLQPGNKFIELSEDNYFEVSIEKGNVELFGGKEPKLNLDGNNVVFINGNSELYYDEYNKLKFNYVEDKYKNIQLSVDLPKETDVVFNEDSYFLVSGNKANVKYHDYLSDDIPKDVKLITDNDACFATNIILSHNRLIHGCFSEKETLGLYNTINELPEEYKQSFNFIEVSDGEEFKKFCSSDAIACAARNNVYFDEDYIDKTNVLVHELAHNRADEIGDFYSYSKEIVGKKYGYSVKTNLFYDTFQDEWVKVAGGENTYDDLKQKIKRTILGFGPVNGCCSSYGCTNFDEDVAECVELAFKNPKKFSKILGKDERYKQKLDLLCVNNFIPEDRCYEIKYGGDK